MPGLVQAHIGHRLIATSSSAKRHGQVVGPRRNRGEMTVNVTARAEVLQITRVVFARVDQWAHLIIIAVMIATETILVICRGDIAPTFHLLTAVRGRLLRNAAVVAGTKEPTPVSAGAFFGI